MVMKRVILLVLLMMLASGIAWAGVRLDWDDSTGSATGRPEGLFASAGTGGEVSTLVLGELPVGEQTPSLTFFLSEPEPRETQTRSLVAVLTTSHSHAQTLDLVTFDASTSVIENSEIKLYEWDIDGDGVFEASTIIPVWEHAFTDNGTYSAQVRITSAEGESDLSEPLLVVVDNQPPAAGFGVGTEAAVEGASIQFEDLSVDNDGHIASWLYDFGDGTQSSDANVSHRYETSGMYLVTLTVTDDDDASSQHEMLISVSNLGPQAAFTLNQATLAAGNSLTLTNTSHDPSQNGAIVHVAWDFGDGTYFAGGPTPDDTYTHTFALPGVYTIELFVIDNSGSMARAQSTITVL